MAQYGENTHYPGQYAQQQYQNQQQYQHPQQYPQAQHFPQAQPQDYNSLHQSPHQPTSYQYPQPYQQQQQQPGHQYPQGYPTQYPHPYQQQTPNPQPYPQQQYAQQYQQQYSQQYPQHNPQHHGYANGYNYGQGVSQTPNNHAAQYQNMNSSQYPAPSGPPNQACYNCGRPDHFVQNCPDARRNSQPGSFRKNHRDPAHQSPHSAPQQANSTLSRSLSFTQPNLSYNQNSQVPSPHSQTPQTPYSTATPHWHGSPQQLNSQAQNYDAHWQNRQFSPNSSQVPQLNQGHSQASESPATPFTATQSHPPLQSGPFNAPPQNEASQSIPSNIPPHFSIEHEQPVQKDDPNGDLSTSDPDTDDLEDDLSKLDVPDLPALPAQHVDGVVKLVSQVLPSNFVVADALYPLPIPPPDAEGKCQSRFFHNKSEEDSLQDFRISPLWRDRLEDTIFYVVEEGGSHITLEQCLSKVKQRRKTPLDRSMRQNTQQAQTVPLRSAEAVEMAEALAKVEQALADAKAKEAEMLARKRKAKAQQPISKERPPSENGKTASSTPEMQLNAPARSPELRPNGKPHSRESRNFSQYTNNKTSPTERMPPNQLPRGPALHSSSSRGRNDSNANRMKQYGQNARNGSRTVVKPIESISPNSHHQGNADQDRRSSFEGRRSCSYMERPPQPNGPDATISRKRNFEAQAESSSDEDDDSPRRQENDVTPKHKKRQPKVESAYSRRW